METLASLMLQPILVIQATESRDQHHRSPGGVLRTYPYCDRWDMARDGHEMLELLKFELKFVEDGGYGRSPRTPWRPPYILEDSPSCPNLGDPSRPYPCSECRLITFVPSELRSERSPFQAIAGCSKFD
jgi:hypothetical protein